MDKRLSVRQIVLFGILGALTFGLKFVMSPLPNIEPVSLLVMVYAVVFGKRSVYPIAVYVAMEILIYGIQLWNLNYLYIWGILAFAAWLMRRQCSPLAWALLSGFFGLLFGALCAPVYLFAGGWGYAVSWWLSGIPYDVLHGIGNFVLAFLLFCPTRLLLSGLYQKA